MDANLGRTRLWAALTGVTGLATLAITVAFRLLPKVKDAGICMTDGTVLQFEFARTAADLTAIFGKAGDPCREPLIAAVDAVNQLDVAAYIPAYTAFAIFAALFIGGGKLRPLVLAAVGMAVVALVADYVETFALLAITPGIETAADLAPRASIAAWIKFGALAAHAVLLAGLCLEAPPRRWILGILLLLPALGFIATLVDPTRVSLLGLGFIAAWVPLMALAIWRAARPAPASP